MTWNKDDGYRTHVIGSGCKYKARDMSIVILKPIFALVRGMISYVSHCYHTLAKHVIWVLILIKLCVHASYLKYTHLCQLLCDLSLSLHVLSFVSLLSTYTIPIQNILPDQRVILCLKILGHCIWLLFMPNNQKIMILIPQSDSLFTYSMTYWYWVR